MSTATANFAMNPKSLLLIFGGMTLSFALILAVMLAAVSPDPKPRRKTTRSRIQQETPYPRAAQTPTRTPRQERAAAQAAQPPTVASETLPAATSQTSPTAPTTPPSAQREAPIVPNKVAMQQLGSLKKDLNRELLALKKDRDAMLKSLAKALTALPPGDIAQQLSALDDPSAATVLREFPPQTRDKVLARLGPKRAQRLNKRLK